MAEKTTTAAYCCVSHAAGPETGLSSRVSFPVGYVMGTSHEDVAGNANVVRENG